MSKFLVGSIVQLIEGGRYGGHQLPVGWQCRVTGTRRSTESGLEYYVRPASFDEDVLIPASALELVAAPAKPKRPATVKQLLKSGAVKRGSEVCPAL